MSGHSKWHSIKHKKGAADAKRGKVFTVHAKLIAIAARAGADPDMNPTLRSAIDRAKSDNVPNTNIDRAIKKGSGADKDAAQYVQLTYESFAQEGSALMIDCITDNSNRSLTNVRIACNKKGGNLGSGGSVAWKFDKKAYFLVDLGGMDHDEAELTLMDCGVDDYSEGEEGKMEVYAAVDQFASVKKGLEDAGFKVEKDELVWKPKENVMISDVEVARKILALIELLEEDDDVSRVTSDAEFTEEVLSQL
jgi:YebC/PmpR family DNA-binding regulatory protein